MRISRIPFCLIVLLVSGCASSANAPTLAVETALPAATASLPTAIPSPPAPLPTAADLLSNSTPWVPTQTAHSVIQVCTPLQDVDLEELPGLVSNPYHPPAAGSDDPHHGVDLSILSPGTDIALAGHTVQAAMAGQAAMILHDRFPYGNAVLVETPLDGVPAAWLQEAQIPTLAPTLPPISA